MDMEKERKEMGREEEKHTVRTRRVGSVTFGLTLICFGILFLVHIAVPGLDYYTIFRLWPVIFILLGVEILVENRRCCTAECKYTYDFAAVLMLASMLLFAMLLACVDYQFVHGWI